MRMNGQLEVAQAENLSSDPSLLPDGRFWLNTTTNVLKAYLQSAVRIFVTTDQTQTLTNKTLTSPVVTAPKVTPTATGTRASPSAVVDSTGVVYDSTLGSDQVWFIEGSGGAVTVSANPAVAVGSRIGEKLLLVGRSDTNKVKFNGGVTQGLSLNGDIDLGDDDVLYLFWDGTYWSEISRRVNG